MICAPWTYITKLFKRHFPFAGWIWFYFGEFCHILRISKTHEGVRTGVPMYGHVCIVCQSNEMYENDYATAKIFQTHLNSQNKVVSLLCHFQSCINLKIFVFSSFSVIIIKSNIIGTYICRYGTRYSVLYPFMQLRNRL